MLKRPGQRIGGRNADQDAKHTGKGEQAENAHRAGACELEDDDFITDNGEQRADRIVHNPFPFQHIGRAMFKVRLPEQRHDHSRPCHHEQPANHYGNQQR